ncbi:type IV pilin-like G/H family protein [Laspinema palackyanum]|uniref:type IV pilin-like G/H family protein n=1 Tax=Laspinema palackyanum TaxID=3231601 RepID=UPI00345D22E6|nr:type IV pilin-like G/H family protein [Laspinema sp. D2c]
MKFLNLGKVFSGLIISFVFAGLTLTLGSNHARGNPDSVFQNYAGTWIAYPGGDQTEIPYGVIRLARDNERLLGIVILPLYLNVLGLLEVIPSQENANKLEGSLYIWGVPENVIQVPVTVEMTENNQNLKLLMLMSRVEENLLPEEFSRNFMGGITEENLTLLFLRMPSNNDVLQLSEPSIEEMTRNNMHGLNRAQQAYFIENNRLTLDISELGVGIPSENENFSYRINSLGDRAVHIIAIPKQEDLNSYTGGVFVLDNQESPINQTVTIVCESEQPSTNPPSPPQLIDQTPQCPSGFREVPR